MKELLKRLAISVEHLKCLDEVFSTNHSEYHRIEQILNSSDFLPIYTEISRELYAGGKQTHGNLRLHRQMILGDVIEYIFTGRAYYYATQSNNHLNNFLKLILYCVNQLLIFDTITVNPDLRKLYIERLESKIEREILYEKPNDQELASELKDSRAIIWANGWTSHIDSFVDSILPKTLGCPKELIVFSELIRSKKGVIIPLLLIQKIFGGLNPISPPDFLIIKNNKEIFGIEVGYNKEEQSREFSIRTSIPTFAVDLKNNMHNRCPKCGENILYCDPVISAYTNGTLEKELEQRGGKFYCVNCQNFNYGNCKFSNYYGFRNGQTFDGKTDGAGAKHYHASCVLNNHRTYRGNPVSISDDLNKFFAQIPQIQGLENI